MNQDPLIGYAVHFTRGATPEEIAALGPEPKRSNDRASFYSWLRWNAARDETGYENAINILGSREIWASECVANVATDIPEVSDVVRGACFSSTRLDSLARLRETRSAYGVGFRLDDLERLGGTPVSYIHADSDEAVKVQARIAQLLEENPVDSTDPFWLQARSIDHYDERHDGRWEEEWRVPGGLDFSVNDVAFLLIPEQLHERARGFFQAALHGNTGPAYLGPYIDSTWDEARIMSALAES